MKIPHVVRSLAANPAYTASSIAVLSFSIAALLAVVAMIEALLFRPPSARAPDELVVVRSSLPSGTLSFPDFIDIRDRNRCFAETFAFCTDASTGLQFDNKLFTVRSCLASAALFQALDIPPAAGRFFEPSDDVPNAAPIAVISSEFSRESNLRPGDIFKLGGQPFTVVGLLPPGFTSFESTEPIDVWIPAAHYDAMMPKWALTSRAFQPLLCGGRLKPGVSVATASAELAVIAHQIEKENPVANHGMTLRAQSLTEFRYANESSTRIIVLLGALVTSLFALAFTNFFALTMLRLLNRHHELAVKVAIGATWYHIARSLIAEVLTIAIVATAFGCALAVGILRLTVLDSQVHDLIAHARVNINGGSLAIIAALVLLCSLLVWLLALRQAARVDVMAAMKESASAPHRHGAFSGLLAIQLGVTVFLVVMAFSFTDALRRTAARIYPFRTHDALLVDIAFRNLGLPGDARIAAADRFLVQLRQTPGVTAVGGVSSAPLSRAGWTNITVNDHDPSLDPDKCIANQIQVTDGYFEAAEIKVLAGRTFDAHDLVTKPNLAVINAAAARRFWPGQNAVGATFKPWETSSLFTVIGVVDDVPTATSRILPSIYLTWGRLAGTTISIHIDVREDTVAVRREIDRTLRTLWPFETTPQPRSMADQVSHAAAELVTAVRVILSVAVLATIVTACGLYFFSSYTASQSRKETAIRQALGARTPDLLRAHAIRYRSGILCGLLLGAALLFFTRLGMEKMGLLMTPLHWTHVAVATLALGAVSAFGLAIPLLKTVRQDLMRSLTGSG